MTKKLLLLCFFMGSFSYAQFNESAPWMIDLNKNKSFSIAKSVDQPYSIYEISDAFNTYWETRDPNVKGSGYKPFKRWENYWMQLVDSDGRLPTSKELWDSWKKKTNTNKGSNATSNWSSVGPSVLGPRLTEIPGFGQPGIGRINAIAVDPNNDNIWYTGAPSGGIWKSIDTGSTWSPMFDEFPQIGVSGIAIDANNSNIVYIATGDDDASDTYSAGVFKSLDGGTTWNETGLNPSNSINSDIMNEIFIDPTNSNIVWVGTNSGLKKSIDGGDTWEVKRAGDITDFRLKPGNPNTIYAVSSNTYYKSVDGGDTFTAIADILPTNGGRMVLGVSDAAPEVLYILVADTQGRNSAFLGLFKSTNSGETFTQTLNTTDVFERNQAWYDLAIAVSNTNADELYTGAINIWKSTNGGDSFSRLNNNDTDVTPAYTHVDIHTLKFYGDKLFCGSDGGLYVSDDNGLTFNDKSAGLEITQFYRISIAKGNDGRIAGGAQDNSGFVLNQGTWNIYTSGDGMDYEIDPNNGNLIYGFVQFGSILYITADAGQSLGGVRAPTDSAGDTIEGEWITPLAISKDGDVYSGFDALYKLNGNEWEKISSNIGSGSIDDLEIDPNNPSIIYAAESNILYKSQNGGITFVLLKVMDSEISDIAINSNDGNIVYLTTSRRVGTSQTNQPTERGVFKITTTGGTVVSENITFNIPIDQAFFSIAHQGRHTDNPIYVGTSLGVYRLDDTLTEWEDYFTNFPNTAVSDLEINLEGEKIIASTYGRGVWRSNIPVQVPNNEIRLVSITPKSNSVLCGEYTPTVEVQNQGSNPITTIEINYTIGSSGNLSTTWTGNLLSSETLLIDLPTQTITEFGQVTLDVNVSIPNDTYDDNNELSNPFFLNRFGIGGAINTFETTDETLIAFNEGAEGSTWQKGVPTGAKLSQAASGTNVYGTNLSGDYPNSTRGILLSNCYELSSILAPVLKFNMAYELELNFDIVYVEYSTDDGTTWDILGNINSQPNWYNSDRTNANSEEDDCQNCPGAQWTGENTVLTEYSYDFSANAALGEIDLTGESNVLFRIVFQSDPAVVEEGVIIDDFTVDGFQDDDDDDNDGVLDINDNCPLLSNANQLDTNADNEGDVCDDDDDGDGILDINDNCPLLANPGQEDDDQDGIGNLCDDDNDNDGIPNSTDLCDNTPLDAVVNIDGCEVFSLPNTNFQILVIGESCISSNNGSISIQAEASLNYTATLTSSNGSSSNSFTNDTTFNDLESGSHTLCIKVEGQSDYENCYDLDVKQPDALSVSSKISTLKNEVTLSLFGGKSYTIVLNDTEYKTSESEITLTLEKVSNYITVKTDLNCQGVHSETILLGTEIIIYPNPVENGDLIVYLGDTEQQNATLALFNINGIKIFNKKLNIDQNEVKFSVDALPAGIYILNVKVGSTLSNYKIIRK